MSLSESAPAPETPSSIWKSVLVLVAFSTVWLGFGDAVIHWLFKDPGVRLRANLFMVVGFVVLNGALFYVLLKRHLRQKSLVQHAAHAQQLLHALSEASPDAIFAKDRGGRYLLVNRGTGKLFGREPDTLVGLDDSRIFPPADVERIRSDDQRVMASDVAVTIEEQIPTARGTRTFLTIKGPLRGPRGEVTGLFGIARDITDRVTAQAKLWASEQRYRELFEVSPLPMAVFALKDFRFKAVNQAAIDTYGHTHEALLAMTIFDVHTPDGQARLKSEIAQNGALPLTRTGNKGRRWTHVRQDGRLIEVEVTTSDLAFEGEPARLVVAKDVTEQVALEAERAQAQAEVEKNRDQLRGVLARVDDGFVALDKDWRYTYLNAQAAKMLGREKPEDLLGRHIWTEFPEGVGQPFQLAYLRAAETLQPVTFEEHFAPWDKWFENRVYPSAEGLTIYFSDVTDRKRAGRVLADRERDFRDLAEQMPALIYRAALDGSHKTLYVSPYVRVLGFTPEQWLADDQAWAKAVHPDDLARVLAALPTATSSMAQAHVEYRLRDAQGLWRHFRDTSLRVVPDDGGPPYLQGVSVDISDLIEAEQASKVSEARLRQSEQRYRLAASSGMVWDWDLEHEDLNVGAEFFEKLGFGPVKGAEVAQRLQALMHPDDLPLWKKVVRDCLLHDKPYDMEFRARDAQGHWHWFHTQGATLRNAAGRVTYMAGTTVDITERKQAREALEQSEARLRISEQRYRLAASHGLVWDWDAASGRMEIGPDFWLELGYPPAAPEVSAAKLAELMHPQDRPVWVRMVREHLLQRKPYDFEYRIRDAQGRWRWMHTQGRAVWDEAGRATYMAGTTVDVTERREAQAALEASEAYRRQLFEQLSDGVLLVGGGHRILDANPRAWALLGLDRDALLARSLPDVLAEQERGRVDRLSQGQSELVEWAFVRQDGSAFPAEVSTRTLDAQRYLVVLRDISQRRKTENALLTYQLELSELTHQLLMQEKQTSRRIAQALHDRLGQTLAVTRLQLDAVKTVVLNQVPSVLESQVERVDALLAQAVQEVRDVLRELRPPLLEEQGLAAALDNEVAAPAVGLGSVDLLLEVDEAVQRHQWPADVEYGAFMVAREAITNALQHGHPSLVRVVLGGSASTLDLEVIDDGRGIPAQMVQGRPGHLGVVGMRERAIAIGARFSVVPGAEGGTRVALHWEAPGS